MSEEFDEAGNPIPPRQIIKLGRKTIYTEELLTALLDYFSVEPFSKHISGRIFPNRMPTFEKFAVMNGISRETMRRWADPNEPVFQQDWADAVEACKSIQKDFLITNGTFGLFNPGFTVFVAKNITDMKDKSEVDHNNPDGKLTPKTIEIVSAQVKGPNDERKD